MLTYNALDHYWIVGGNGPHVIPPDTDPTGDDSRVFSSAANAYVAADGPVYVAWRDDRMAMNGGLDPTTRIDTEENLAAVLEPYGITPNFAASEDIVAER